MSSSSSDKGRSPLGLDSPDALKKLTRSRESCNGCLKFRVDLAGASFKVCGGCRTVSYCSSACQAAHWRSGHKLVCKERAQDLADVRAAAPGPNFVAELEQWVRRSKLLLVHLAVAMLHEAAESASRAGLSVRPEDLALKNCMALHTDYTPGRFRIRDNPRLTSFDAMEATAAETADPGLQSIVEEMREAKVKVADGGQLASSDFVVLNILIHVGGIMRQLRAISPRVVVNRNNPGLARTAVAERVKEINSWFGGAGTENSRG